MNERIRTWGLNERKKTYLPTYLPTLTHSSLTTEDYVPSREDRFWGGKKEGKKKTGPKKGDGAEKKKGSGGNLGTSAIQSIDTLTKI